MTRRYSSLLALVAGLILAGCGATEPTVSREVTPGRPGSGSSTITDPGAATRPPRAIATH